MFKIFILIIAISCFNFNISNSTEIDEAKKLIETLKKLNNLDFKNLDKLQEDILNSVFINTKMNCANISDYRMCTNNLGLYCFVFDDANMSFCLSSQDILDLSTLLTTENTK
jgi:hypothetical protein